MASYIAINKVVYLKGWTDGQARGPRVSGGLSETRQAGEIGASVVNKTIAANSIV